MLSYVDFNCNCVEHGGEAQLGEISRQRTSLPRSECVGRIESNNTWPCGGVDFGTLLLRAGN